MVYLYPKQIIYLHKQIIFSTGGSHGVRNKGMLESAVYRPQATYGQQDLYPDLFLKAAVLGHSMIGNHPFIDGNKRVGYQAMRLFLRLNGYDIKASLNEKYNFVMNVASSRINEHGMHDWLKAHIIQKT